MDQVKTQLAVVLKYGFWIASFLVLLGSLAVWHMTTSKLAAESASQRSKIEQAVNTVKSVRDELPTMPNEHSHAEMNRLILERQGHVVESWQSLYDRQRDILTWPVKELKQDFVDEFKDLIPIELYYDFPTDPFDEKETTLLTRYEMYIKNVLPDIAKIGGTEWTAAFGRSGGMGMGMGYGMGGVRKPTVDITGAKGGPLVKWSDSSQTQVLTDLFPWRGSTPSTLQVYYSQENIWILKQLLQIIAAVNGEARQAYQAKIHEIQQIGIGRSVKFGAGQISLPGSGSVGMSMGMDYGMEMGMDYEMEMGMEMDMGGDYGGSVTQIDPGDNRYVDTNLEPITGATLRSALASNSPDTASLAVAKRVPVMLSLNMDQRAVPDLLAACGSAPLMVDIIQVRLLPQGTAASSGGGGMGMGMMDDYGMGMESEMDMDMGMEMEMGMGMGMGMGYGAGMTTQTKVEEFPLDMAIEIYGIIYIYNPPDAEKLGVKDVTEDFVMDGATETLGGQPVAPKPAETQPTQLDGELPTPQPDQPDQTPPAAPATPDADQAAPPVAGAGGVRPPTAMIPVQP